MALEYTPISEFNKDSFSAPTRNGDNITHDIYSRGDGPPVVLIQELPGIGCETLRLADKLIQAGFSIVLPHLFGPLEKTSTGGNLLRVMCMRREFALFSANKSSPIVDWLRALCANIKASREAKGVGVIGMCLTGNFAITLVGDDSVLAAVSAQPAMPFHKQAALHMSADEVDQARQGLDRNGPMLGFRFEGDKLSTAAKFACIHDAFNNDDSERVRLCTLPGNGHSVFTLDFVDEQGHPTHEALGEVIQYFTDKLD